MNNDLLKAILAMDSYNRGYGEGIKLNFSQIGTATFSTGSNILPASDEVTAGFYAAAYTLSTGEKVIAYRGTVPRQHKLDKLM